MIQETAAALMICILIGGIYTVYLHTTQNMAWHKNITWKTLETLFTILMWPIAIIIRLKHTKKGGST